MEGNSKRSKSWQRCPVNMLMSNFFPVLWWTNINNYLLIHFESSESCHWSKSIIPRISLFWISLHFLVAWWRPLALGRRPWLGPKKIFTVLPILMIVKVSWDKRLVYFNATTKQLIPLLSSPTWLNANKSPEHREDLWALLSLLAFWVSFSSTISSQQFLACTYYILQPLHLPREPRVLHFCYHLSPLMTATTIFRIKEGLRVAQAEDRLSDAVGDGWRVDFGEGRRGDV